MNKKIIAFLMLTALLALPACQNQSKEENTQVKTEETTPKENQGEVETKTQEKEEEATSSKETAFTSFEAPNLEGETVSQEIFKDKKLTMINIWGTFCGPCIEEMPYLGALNKEYADKGFQVVGLVVDTIDDDWNIDPAQVEKAKEMSVQTGADYTHFLPTEDLIQNRLIYSQVIPETIFVDSTGKQIGDEIIGSRNKEQWSEIIDEKLAEVE